MWQTLARDRTESDHYRLLLFLAEAELRLETHANVNTKNVAVSSKGPCACIPMNGQEQSFATLSDLKSLGGEIWGCGESYDNPTEVKC